MKSNYNYTDTYTTTVRNARRMAASDLFRLLFVCYPKPVQYLLKLRNRLVKPFGLQTGGDFAELMQEQNEEKAVFVKRDKHLTLQVQLECSPPDIRTRCQSVRITTFVRFHNSLGKTYFFFIRPFHCLICKSLLKRAVRNWERETANDYGP